MVDNEAIDEADAAVVVINEAIDEAEVDVMVSLTDVGRITPIVGRPPLLVTTGTERAMTLELMLMEAVAEDRRRELKELLRHAGYDTGAEAARQGVARRPLARLRRVLPRLRVHRRQPA